MSNGNAFTPISVNPQNRANSFTNQVISNFANIENKVRGFDEFGNPIDDDNASRLDLIDPTLQTPNIAQNIGKSLGVRDFTQPITPTLGNDFTQIPTGDTGGGDDSLLIPDAFEQGGQKVGEFAGDSGPSLGQKLFGYYDEENRRQVGGAFKPVVEGITGVGNLLLGRKQLKQSGRALDIQQDQFNRNFSMQTEMINRRLEDRQRARLLLRGHSSADADAGARKHVQQFGVKEDNG